MAPDTPPAPAVPTEPAECRRRAESALCDYSDPARAGVWALLAVAGELREVRRQLDKRGR